MSPDDLLFGVALSERWTRARFDLLVEKIGTALGVHTRVGVHTSHPVLIAACLIACSGSRRDLVLFPPHDQITPESYCEPEGLTCLIEGDATTTQFRQVRNPRETATLGRAGIFTSGSSGTPKLVYQRWQALQSLAAFVRETHRRRRWLMTYAPTSYAGLQVFFSCILSEGSLFYTEGSVLNVCRLMSSEQIEIVSATPTFWRILLTAWPPDIKRPDLLQATLGGEIARQDLLDSVRREFRPSKITHIYATTEAGTIAVVSDGAEGFPASLLEAPTARIRLNGAGCLEVAVGPDKGAWIQTPDLVEVRGGRVIFKGRDDTVVNIGGMKVNPVLVEEALERLPGISVSRVFGKPSPVTGNVLVAEVVPARGAAIDPERIRAALRQELPRHLVPASIAVVAEIKISQSGKKIRAT